MSPDKDKKFYAYFEHETVQAMLHSLFRFQSAMQAQLVSNRFADQVILAPHLSDPKERKAIFLWVRDLDVTEEQRRLGYLGNYAKISVLQLPNGRWTLSMVRVDLPLNKHPIYQKIKRPYPNAGHPLLRSLARGKTFPSMQAASDALMGLHEEFPDVSIPGVGKLRIQVYARSPDKGKSPVQRVELQVVKREDDLYIITSKLLTQEKGTITSKTTGKAPIKLPNASTPTEATTGRYTNMVAKQRKRKKK